MAADSLFRESVGVAVPDGKFPLSRPSSNLTFTQVHFRRPEMIEQGKIDWALLGRLENDGAKTKTRRQTCLRIPRVEDFRLRQTSPTSIGAHLWLPPQVVSAPASRPSLSLLDPIPLRPTSLKAPECFLSPIQN